MTIEPAALEAIARGADGGMRDAESTLDQLISFCGETIQESDVLSMFGLTSQAQVLSLGEAVLRTDAAGALGQLHELTTGGKELSLREQQLPLVKGRRVVAERSGRAMYAVTGSGASGGRGGEGRDETPYLCFPAHFCSCRSFFWESVSRGEALACKHQLAAKLASVLGAHSTTTVDDVLLGNMMMRYFEGDG